MRGLRAGIALAVLAAVALSPAAAPAATLHGTVTRVIDGDTIRVVSRGFETPVRLIGIDTPETRAPGTPVQCFGPAATRRVQRLLPAGRRVILVTDPTQATRDRYGRLLAYVHLPGRRGPAGSVNWSLVRSGHAKVLVYGGERFRHAVPFFRAQHRARKAGAGLWGPPCRGDTTKPDPSVRRPAPPPATGVPVADRGRCGPDDAGACIPVHPPDVDCTGIPDRNVRVVGTDVHRLDVDRDGVACEE